MTDAMTTPEITNRLESETYSGLAMLAGMQLDIFTPLENGAMTAEEIANKIGVGGAYLKRLLYALVAAELLTVEGERFSNTPESNRFLVRDKPTYVGGRHGALSRRWSAILNTAETIKTSTPQARVDFSSMPESQMDAYFRGFNTETIAIAKALAERYDFSRHRSLLDVGGGAGSLAVTLTESYPGLNATVADLPTVTPITRRFTAEMDATDRVQVVDCNIVDSPPNGDFDVAVVSRLIQVLSPDQARSAIVNVGQVISPGGVIHIAGHMLDDSRLSPPEIVKIDLLFLNTYDAGQAYTEGEHSQWLAEAGFEGFERVPAPNGMSIITAQMPA